MDVFEKVTSIIKDKCIYDKDISSNTLIAEDLGVDSFDFISLMDDIEKEFNIAFSYEKSQSIKTIGDLVNYVQLNL